MGMQDLYWAPPFFEGEILYWSQTIKSEQLSTPSESTVILAIKIASLLLVAVIFIFWIVSFIKIRKIDDKVVKRNKIKNVVIIVSILVILIIALLFSAPLLTKYFS